MNDIESIDSSRHEGKPFTNKYMDEDIEMMSKEIEQIRDQILNSSPMPVRFDSDTNEASEGKHVKKLSYKGKRLRNESFD